MYPQQIHVNNMHLVYSST